MATLTELTARIRRLCGNPDTTEVPDADIQGLLNNEVLGWLNRRRPGLAITHFHTVANQQDYDVLSGVTYYSVGEVWWSDSDFEFFSPEIKYVPGGLEVNTALAGFDTMDNPALVEAFLKNVSAYRDTFRGRGIETEERKIRLEPVPSSVDDVYFEYSYPRFSAAADVTPNFVEGLVYKAAAMALDFMSIKRGMIRGAKNFSGGGGENEKEMARKYEVEAEREIPAGIIFYRG